MVINDQFEKFLTKKILKLLFFPIPSSQPKSANQTCNVTQGYFNYSRIRFALKFLFHLPTEILIIFLVGNGEFSDNSKLIYMVLMFSLQSNFSFTSSKARQSIIYFSWQSNDIEVNLEVLGDWRLRCDMRFVQKIQNCEIPKPEF